MTTFSSVASAYNLKIEYMQRFVFTRLDN